MPPSLSIIQIYSIHLHRRLIAIDETHPQIIEWLFRNSEKSNYQPIKSIF